MPTEMYCLSVRIRASCLKRPRSDPLPKGLLIDAWKAIVGYSFESSLSHFFVTQDGTCRLDEQRNVVGPRRIAGERLSNKHETHHGSD